MKSLLHASWVLGIALLCSPFPAAGTDQTSPASRHYTIGAGDLILISVWKDEALTRQVVVLPDGKISFPLVGEIQAEGRSIEQLRNELESKLERFVPGVTLSVIVQQVNSQVVYVIGRVTTPGRFLLTGEINVLQALAMAGGLNPFAKKGEIKIFRQEDGSTKIFSFNYDAVSTGSDLKQNITLQRGDVIVVP